MKIHSEILSVLKWNDRRSVAREEKNGSCWSCSVLHPQNSGGCWPRYTELPWIFFICILYPSHSSFLIINMDSFYIVSFFFVKVTRKYFNYIRIQSIDRNYLSRVKSLSLPAFWIFVKIVKFLWEKYDMYEIITSSYKINQ